MLKERLLRRYDGADSYNALCKSDLVDLLKKLFGSKVGAMRNSYRCQETPWPTFKRMKFKKHVVSTVVHDSINAQLLYNSNIRYQKPSLTPRTNSEIIQDAIRTVLGYPRDGPAVFHISS